MVPYFFRNFGDNIQCEINLDITKAPSPSLLDSICALLNSGGGVLYIKVTESQQQCLKMFDTFWGKLEEKLITMIKHSVYDDVFDRKINGDEIFLFVKGSNHLCTVEFNLFTPLDSKRLPATYSKVLKLLQQRKKSTSVPEVPIHKLPALPDKFNYNTALTFHESKQIQLKYCLSNNGLLHNNNRTQLYQIREWISAFGNGSGGMIVFGIDDKNCKILGKRLEGDEKDEFESTISSIVSQMSQAWCFIPQRGVHWNVKFFPVEGKSSQSALTVVVLYIAGMQNLGGIFTKCPRSCELRLGLDGREEVHRLSFEDWKQQMLGATQDESEGIEYSSL